MERKRTYQIISIAVALAFLLLFAFMYGSCREGADQPADEVQPLAQVVTVVVPRAG